MKLFLPGFLFLLVITGFSERLQSQCNSAFSFTINQNAASFSANDSASNLSHGWRFGDGTLGYGIHTTHTYSSPGSYTVWHIVSDSLNTCRDSTAQVITISFTASCNANFYYRTDSFQYNYYTFIANPTINGGSVQSYSWKIDGVQASTSYMFITSLTPGTHQVCLEITTTAACTASSCQTVIANITGNCGWQASFTYSANPGNPKQISFSPSPGQSTMRYQWRFGDGYGSTVKNPVHTYAAGGNYNVRLAVYDSISRCLDTLWKTVQVYGVPADSCTASFTYALNAQGQATFTALSNQTITSQLWTIKTFWDSVYTVTLNSFNPTYTFTDTTYYQVCLKLTTNTGCIRTYCEGITVTSVSRMNAGNRVPSYPNPAGNYTRINIAMENAATISIAVYNLSGNIVYSTVRQGTTGDNLLIIPLDKFQKGQYFVDIQYNGNKKRSVFIKL